MSDPLLMMEVAIPNSSEQNLHNSPSILALMNGSPPTSSSTNKNKNMLYIVYGMSLCHLKSNKIYKQTNMHIFRRSPISIDPICKIFVFPFAFLYRWSLDMCIDIPRIDIFMYIHFIHIPINHSLLCLCNMYIQIEIQIGIPNTRFT